MSSIVLTILLLVISNCFMTFAWYGHLKLAEFKWFHQWPMIAVIALILLIIF